MHNLIEYSDSSGILYQFKRDESPMNNAVNAFNVALNNSSSFEYKADLLGKKQVMLMVMREIIKKCKNSCSTEISIQLF